MSFRISKSKKKGSTFINSHPSLNDIGVGWLDQQSTGTTLNRSRKNPNSIVNPYLLEKLHIQREEEKTKQEYFREWA